MPSASQRLRLATRIHFALLRHFDENVEVASLLRGDAEAREALWVCDASGDAELAQLARTFRAAGEPAAPDAGGAHDTGWDADGSGFGTTGFGITEFNSTGFGSTGFPTQAELGIEPPAARPSMFGWLGRRALR